MTRELVLTLSIDGDELVLDRATLDDDQPLTTWGVVKGLYLLADRIAGWAEAKRRFGDIVKHIDDPETAA